MYSFDSDWLKINEIVNHTLEMVGNQLCVFRILVEMPKLHYIATALSS
jgi:hypothetical protein